MVLWGPSENRLLYNYGTASTVHGRRVLYSCHGWDSAGPVFLLYVCQEKQAAWADNVRALGVRDNKKMSRLNFTRDLAMYSQLKIKFLLS
jgi:hypothetical protein